jgi:hypothetical protein
MRRLLVFALFVPACLALLAAAAPARALVVALPTLSPTRVAEVDTVVVGRVMGIEDKDVELAPAPNAPANTKYRVAIVAVAEDIKGAKGVKMIRVAFTPPPMIQNPDGGIRPIPRPPFMQLDLKTGQEGLFYLTKHFKESVYLTQSPTDVTLKENPEFAKQVEKAKTTIKLLENPTEALKSKDAEQRLFAAALLIAKYRKYQLGKTKTEPIDAEESKLILKALADANWQPVGRPLPGRPGNQINALQLFSQLGVTAKDGFQPQPNVPYQESARAWLRDNVEKYRIQRIVAADR